MVKTKNRSKLIVRFFLGNLIYKSLPACYLLSYKDDEVNSSTFIDYKYTNLF